jgi:hypothetical protein
VGKARGARGRQLHLQVYRRRQTGSWSCVAAGLTTPEWTDEEITIDPQHGLDYFYCATASTSLSPQSDFSNQASIHGYVGKPLVQGEQDTAEQAMGGRATLSLYPNPFNPYATVFYSLPRQAHVRLFLCSLLGQKVLDLVDELQSAGSYHVPLDGSRLPSGLYLLRLVCGDQAMSHKVLLLR